ncbi:MAG: hypothetical protein ACHQ4H_08345 [Ktedonobacterales bacterium]
MIITPTQTFLASLIFAGGVGARRGWAREVITCAVVLSTVLFLSNGGGGFLAHLFSGAVGSAAGGSTAVGGPLFAGGGGTAPTGTATTTSSFSSTCTAGLVAAISNVTFVGLSWVGYRSGSRYGPPPKMSSHHVAGVVPGFVNGAAIAYYVSHYIFPNTTVLLNTPGSIDTASYLPAVFGVGLAALLIVLFVAGQMKKASTGK